MGQFFRYFLLLFPLTAFSTGAQATLAFVTDRALWESAVGGSIATEDFNAVAPFTLNAGSNAAGLIDIELVNVLGPTNRIGDISTFWNIDGTTGFLGGVNANGAENILINLPVPVFGWGADFSTTHSGGGLTLEINSEIVEFEDILPDGDILQNPDGSGFVGVISTTAFSTIRLFDVSQNETFGMDNVSFAVTAVPEPAIPALLGLGLAGFGFARYRKVR